MIEMELDHDTGEMNGTVLAGPFAGRALDELDEDGAAAASTRNAARPTRTGRAC